MVSRPSNTMEPSRWLTMPMMDFSVVVLPAPLRPRSVTTSPARTSRPTPCRMWESPYQALSALTDSSGVAESAIALPQVSLDHVRICGDGLVVALGKDFSPLQHRDAVRQIGDHRK